MIETTKKYMLVVENEWECEDEDVIPLIWEAICNEHNTIDGAKDTINLSRKDGFYAIRITTPFVDRIAIYEELAKSTAELCKRVKEFSFIKDRELWFDGGLLYETIPCNGDYANVLCCNVSELETWLEAQS